VAMTKWRSLWSLSVHVLIYWLTLAVLVPFGLLFNYVDSKPFFEVMRTAQLIAAANAFLHFAVDFFESRIVHWFWDRQDMHNFFVVIGFCQFLHVSLLLATANALMQ